MACVGSHVHECLERKADWTGIYITLVLSLSLENAYVLQKSLLWQDENVPKETGEQYHAYDCHFFTVHTAKKASILHLTIKKFKTLSAHGTWPQVRDQKMLFVG